MLTVFNPSVAEQQITSGPQMALQAVLQFIPSFGEHVKAFLCRFSPPFQTRRDANVTRCRTLSREDDFRFEQWRTVGKSLLGRSTAGLKHGLQQKHKAVAELLFKLKKIDTRSLLTDKRFKEN